MSTDFIVSKDRPEVTHIPTGMVWEFRQTPEGYWDGLVVNMDKCPKWPADRLAKLSGQAGDAFLKEWKL